MDEKALNELLECSVCLEGLDASSKVLPCQHTFCRRCLDEIVTTKNELRCPECRTLVEVPVEDLPINVLLIRLLEGMKNAKSGIGQTIVSANSCGYSLHSSGHRRSGSSQGSHGLRTSLGHKNVTPTQPCAKALYNYEGTEPGDLSFKKGDVILLRKQVDENWYHGELNSHHGFFPATYVHVIVPLPQEIPKCKALYDFEINDQSEKDCLTFRKEEIVTVIRRVDDNWAEGRKGDQIGIFPIAFVEMNDAAKWLINNQTAGQLSTRTVPAGSNHQSANNHISSSANTNNSNAVVNPEPSAATSVATVTPSSSVAMVTTYQPISPILPHPSSITATAFLSTPMLGTSLMTQSLIVAPSTMATAATTTTGMVHHPSLLAVQRTNSKRHSMSTFSPHHHKGIVMPHRHSMEISPTSGPLSLLEASSNHIPVCPTSSLQLATNLASALSSATPAVVSQPSPVAEAVATTSNAESSSQLDNQITHTVSSGTNTTPAESNTPQVTKPNTQEEGSVTQTTEAVVATTPAIFIALYNYKPRKEDEIELRKGDYFALTERCQDGWFKGICIRTKAMGVFPGNYVQLLKPKPSGSSSSRSVSQATTSPSSSPVASTTSPSTTVTSPSQVSVSRTHSFPKTSPHASQEYASRGISLRSPAGRVFGTPTRTPAAPALPHRSQNHSSNGVLRPQIVMAPRPQLGISHLTATAAAAAAAASTSSATSSATSPSSLLSSASSTPSWSTVSQYSAASSSSHPSSHSPRSTRKSSKHQAQHVIAASSRSSAQQNDLQQNSIVTPPNVVVGAIGGENPKQQSTPVHKERKEKKDRDKIGLVRRLTKKKKVPTATLR